MKNLKTVLFYVLGLAGLVVVSVLYTGRMEADIRPLPTATPVVRNTPTLAPTTEADQGGCRITPRGSSYGYLPDAPLTTTLASPDLQGEQLVISGTVYASDCTTPLPGVLLEVWQNDAGDSAPAASAGLRAQMRTDAQGHYEFTAIKPRDSQNWPAHIHYRITFPDGDNALTTMIFFDDVLQDPDAPTINAAAIVSLTATETPDGPRLRGTFDIVLPVEAPAEASRPDCVATPHSTGASSIAEVPFTTTLAPLGLKGTRLIISGTVYAADQRTPLPGALLEVWHANADGRYDNTLPLTLRAKMRTDSAGQFEFTTIKPGHVQVGCERLPAHINYLVSYSGYRPLFMSQFFAGDPYLADPPPMREAAITPLMEEQGADGPVLHGRFDIVLPANLAKSTPTP